SSEHFADYFHEQFYGDDNANGARVDRKLRKKIFELEESNLAPKSWELSGEVTAFNRSENALLEQHIDFDHAAKLPPLVTVDTTRKLESMITQRIRDKIFDDVERKVRESESEVKYRAAVEEQYTKKSLVEVYEEQYQKIHGVNEGKVDEKVIEIGKMMSSLFRKLDALSHYNYIPPEAQSEIHIVNNMPALQREEVGPTASTNEMLIAPEEIKKHIKGTLKNKDERNETDRARERRKKKVALHLKRLKNSVFIDRKKDKKVEKKIKKCKEKRLEERSVKSSKFFEQLQRTTADEVFLNFNLFKLLFRFFFYMKDHFYMNLFNLFF
ncbi:unnamed protein product, partial [Dracunculus medinensis]|uniref:Protein LTV1 homolog n=1 Tax=Dracunculus medinensis TaxID=318479 RepID=A0A0N4UA72_DRAME